MLMHMLRVNAHVTFMVIRLSSSFMKSIRILRFRKYAIKFDYGTAQAKAGQAAFNREIFVDNR